MTLLQEEKVRAEIAKQEFARKITIEATLTKDSEAKLTELETEEKKLIE